MDILALLGPARRGGYAVGAFNAVDYSSARAVVEAAEELQAPVIVQFSVKTVKYWGCGPIAAWMADLEKRSSAPLSYHLDHCKETDVIRECLTEGWPSVMIDASSLPFEENLKTSLEVAGWAAAAGARIEAELGTIGGVEEDIAVGDDDARLVNPAQAIEFCRQVKPAIFAPAIGTAHGVYKGEPRIAFDRLEAIAAQVAIPLALHGGTGLSEEVFRRCMALGCAKVNISTQLKYAFIDGFCDCHAANPKDYEPLKPLDAQFQRVKAAAKEKIEQFGSAGKAGDARGSAR
ncbi:MAG: D-tagatose-1,6-bisphosphate aldolase subunit GatY [candidate division BRC1 bacterium ADurb.BinA364]|nr:MAG: D-tagatose-1,6-bisphosphate aldolase subunit GatY [candidate division BRC1 bacterium ADurb.BinA364]